MLAALNLPSLDALVDTTVPKGIRLEQKLTLQVRASRGLPLVEGGGALP